MYKSRRRSSYRLTGSNNHRHERNGSVVSFAIDDPGSRSAAPALWFLTLMHIFTALEAGQIQVPSQLQLQI